MTKFPRGYHFVGATLRDGSPIPADGVWLEVAPPLAICVRGLHVSRYPFDALQYAPGNTLCLVEYDQVGAEQKDKLVCARRRIVARFDSDPLLREFARSCALDVSHLWDAPPVVRSFLETGDESLRAAANAAANAAARAAARDAANAAARDAANATAWDAARNRQRTLFGDAVCTEFIAMGVEP